MNAEKYNRLSEQTVQIDWRDSKQLSVLPLGIVGELGSLASVTKKKIRDGSAYLGYEDHVVEEVGDILWYLFAIARRVNVNIVEWPNGSSACRNIEESIFRLSSLVQRIIEVFGKYGVDKKINSSNTSAVLEQALIELRYISNSVDKNLGEVARFSIEKIESLWKGDVTSPAPIFDKEYSEFERLPRVFEIEFIEINNESDVSSQTQNGGNNDELIIRMNNVQLGDRLTDNSWEVDGYRYHDIFHMAGAALLGWSPVFRRMLKKKRKSNKEVDEKEDGARAAVIEEALVSQVYDYGESHKFSSELSSIDIAVIKNICTMVRNYEAKVIKPWEWKHYMLSTFTIFREIRYGFSGKIRFDAGKREISIVNHHRQ